MTTNQAGLRQLQYQITAEDYAALRARLTAGTEESGASSVHAMYFTSYRNRALAGSLRDFLEGEPSEPRFSLTYYDNDPTYLRLERLPDGLRTGAMVTEAECRALLSGETDWLLDRHNPVLLDFHDSLTERMLLPQVLLTYRREVYEPEGMDLRLALDTDIRATLQHMDFLDPQLLERDTVGQEGRILMQISYTDTIPEDVMCLLEETAPRRRLLAERRVAGERSGKAAAWGGHRRGLQRAACASLEAL